LKEGIQKTVRYVGDNLENATPIIQIDPKKSAFFPEVTIFEFLSAFFPGQAPLADRLRNPQTQQQASKQVKGLVVMSIHLRENRCFEVNGLSNTPASETMFETAEGGQISVADYMFSQYNYRLTHPRLPVRFLAGAGNEQFIMLYGLLVRHRGEASSRRSSAQLPPDRAPENRQRFVIFLRM